MVVALMALASSWASAAEVGVTPAWMDVDLTPGQVKAFRLSVVNDGSRPLVFEPSIVDVVLNEGTNEVAYQPDPTALWAIGPYLTVTPRIISVPPGETRQIQVRMLVPEDDSTRGGRYGAIKLRTVQRDEDGQRTAANIGMQFTVPILVDVGSDFERGLTLDRTTVQPTPAGTLADIKLAITNTGASHEKPVVMLALQDSEGTVLVTHRQASERYFLPGQTRELPMRWIVDVPPGHYDLVGVVRSGTVTVPFQSELDVLPASASTASGAGTSAGALPPAAEQE